MKQCSSTHPETDMVNRSFFQIQQYTAPGIRYEIKSINSCGGVLTIISITTPEVRKKKTSAPGQITFGDIGAFRQHCTTLVATFSGSFRGTTNAFHLWLMVLMLFLVRESAREGAGGVSMCLFEGASNNSGSVFAQRRRSHSSYGCPRKNCQPRPPLSRV